MARRAQRGEDVESQTIHELGVRGRKTGVVLPDQGLRDEHGMQPLDSIFSSARKAPGSARTSSFQRTQQESGSEDMDIASSAGPGPQTLLKNRRSIPLPIPRSRSPLKTNLKSPARRNPHLEHLSSPSRRSISEDRDATVTRKLDFSSRIATSKSALGANASSRINGIRQALAEADDEDEDEDDQDGRGGQDEHPAYESEPADYDGGAEPDLPDMDMGDAMDAGGGSEDPDDSYGSVDRNRTGTYEPARRPPAAQSARVAKPRPEVPRERPPHRRYPSEEMHGSDPSDAEYPDERRHKRRRTDAPEPRRPASRPTSQRSTEAVPKRPRGRPKGKRKVAADEDEDAGETSFMALQRGPPLPRARGLVSVRRDANSVLQTRSGRSSYRPLEYWKGEQVVHELEPDEGQNFVLSSTKEVLRIPDDAQSSRRQPTGRRGGNNRGGGRPRLASVAQEEEDEDMRAEEWETAPGTVSAEIILWDPEHEVNLPGDDDAVDILEQEVALSGRSVVTQDVQDATFRFAKVLTTPFMGAGVVDLPPGTEKRTKNSRRMHMAFFVHTGKVLVTINETQFRITAGGMWFVPRGNFYSITNDYAYPSRVFFTQANEVPVELDE